MNRKNLITTLRRSGFLVKNVAFFFSFLFFSFIKNSQAQITCADYDHVSFEINSATSLNPCFEDRYVCYFKDNLQSSGPAFDAHQLLIELKISGDGVFNQVEMLQALQNLTPPTLNFQYGTDFPDEQTFQLVAYCSANPWEVPFGNLNNPMMEAIVTTQPGGTYSIQSTVKTWVSPATGCNTECTLSSGFIGPTPTSPPACSNLSLELKIDGYTPVNGVYTIDPHEEVTARLTLTNTGTAPTDISDFDLKLSLDDLHGTLPLPAPNSPDWVEFFIEATQPAGEPAYETHGSPFHYFQYGTLNETTLQPNVPVQMMVFSIAPPEELENILGELFAQVEYARILDGNGNCCELDASNINFTVEFPGILPCDPNKEIKFSMEPASGFDDCETGFNIATTLTDGLGGTIPSIDLDELQLEFTTISTENLEMLEITGGPAGVSIAFDCTSGDCPNGVNAPVCQTCTATLIYQDDMPLTLSNGDTWTVVFRGSDGTAIEMVDFVSASVLITGATESCVPVTEEGGVAQVLPLANTCHHCLDYSVFIGPYGGNQILQNCQEGFSVYLNAPALGSSVTGIMVGLDFQNPGGLTVTATGNGSFCYPFYNTCPPVPGNCVAVNGNNITYSLCLAGIGLPNPPVRLFDVVVAGDGCLTDMIFNMQTMIHPTGGDPCIPMDVSVPSPHEVCITNCQPSEFLFSGNISAFDNNEVNYDVEVPIEPPGIGVLGNVDAGIYILGGGETPDGICDDLTETLPPPAGVDCNGQYEATVPCINSNTFTIKPKKNTKLLNGVTTFDLVLITKHIIGVQLLGSPYKIIAADANKSNSVTTFDIVELRKLILFIITELPNHNTSWRFVDADYQFPDPADPWSEPFPEVKNITFTGQNNTATNLDFIAIKVGDVNGSAKCDDDLVFAPSAVDDRSTGVKLLANTSALASSSGTVDIGFGVNSETPLAAWQFGLCFDPAFLQFEEAIPETDLDGMTVANFGATEAAGGRLRVIWYDPYGGTNSFGGRRNFRLRFRVLRPINGASKVLWLDDEVLQSKAYEEDGTARTVTLETTETGLAGYAPPATNELYVEALPNPFGNEVKFVVQATREEDFELSVFDVHGRLVARRTGKTGLGQVFIRFDSTGSWGSGVFTYRVRSASQSVTGKVIKQ